MEKVLPFQTQSAFLAQKSANNPLGLIRFTACDDGLLSVDFQTARSSTINLIPGSAAQGILYSAIKQMEEYLSGARKAFDLKIYWEIFSDFERGVLQETLKIPFGQTRTYGEIAALIQNPMAARAVGGVMRKNPMPIIIPCHRVLSSNKKLTGYSGPGGIQTKAWLLQLEGCSDYRPSPQIPIWEDIQ